MSDVAPSERGPTTEIGYQGIVPPPWSTLLLDFAEQAPQLRWPTSIVTYHAMRADSQVDALCRAVDMPVRRKRWVVDPNGARDEVVEQVASDMGLPILGQKDAPRGRHRFNHDEHLRMALLGKWYGHMYFEQVGDIDDELAWRMKKLSPRLPQSIQQIGVSDQGDLTGIRQYGLNWGSRRPTSFKGPWLGPDPIPATQLAPYVWDREGADWFGRSMLRPLYRHWLVKDRLIRIDAMKNERFGVGIPKAIAPKGTRDIASYGALAQGVRAGDATGVGLPNGADLYVEGIRGQLPDTIASIQYHDAAMARAFLAMFIELGQTATGSRALGHTFFDFFDMSIDTVCGWYAVTTNEWVIEDMVDWNWGEDEQAPLVTWEEDEHAPATAADLVALIGANALTVDADLEGWIRDRYGAPPMMEGEQQAASVPTPAPVVAPPPATASRRVVRPKELGVALRAGDLVEARKQTIDSDLIGHRMRTDVEVRAAVDFAAIQKAWQDTTKSLVDKWADVKAAQVDSLLSQIEAAVEADNVGGLASITAPVMGADVISEHMIDLATKAIDAATEEAAAQGATITPLTIADLTPGLTQRAGAVASMMSRSLSDAASRQALQRYGTSVLSGSDVAAGVKEHLDALGDSYLNDQLGGAMNQAQNTGRNAVMSQADNAQVYSSELLDENTCDECNDEDGTQYDSLDDAEASYPSGGFVNCEGGPRCRGTLVAVYDTEGSDDTGGE